MSEAIQQGIKVPEDIDPRSNDILMANIERAGGFFTGNHASRRREDGKWDVFFGYGPAWYSVGTLEEAVEAIRNAG